MGDPYLGLVPVRFSCFPVVIGMRPLPLTHLRRIRLDYLFGLHSGIPRCCVLQFCKERRTDVYSVPEKVWPRMDLEVRYRPCQRCYDEIKAGIREPARLLICEPNHPDYHGCGIPLMDWWSIQWPVRHPGPLWVRPANWVERPEVRHV